MQTMVALQIDAINTVIRSHYMPLYSRLGPYNRKLLDARVFTPQSQLADRRGYFEYWGHECSILPIDLYPLFRWRMDDAKQGKGVYKQLHNLALRKPEYIAAVKQQVQEQGVSTCRDLNSAGAARGKGMWEWSESKQALEYLFCTGELASTGRLGFSRLYDVRERAIPASLWQAPAPNRHDAQCSLLEIAAQSLGVATSADLRDYFRINAADASLCIERLQQEQRIEPVRVEGWKQIAYRVPGCSIPRGVTATTLLTPFDPIVWHRGRAARLFDFDYRIEIYVPAAKRQYGYYVMPVLLDDRIVARIDLKSDRDRSLLLVKGAWMESHTQPVEVADRLFGELQRFANWLGLEKLQIARRGDLASFLRRRYVS